MKHQKLAKVITSIHQNKNDKYISFLIFITFILILTSALKWAIHEANWEVVYTNLPLYFFGSFPEDKRWRPTIWIGFIIIISFISIFNKKFNLNNKFLFSGWLIVLPLGTYLLAGGYGIESVSSRYWGGLSLTIFLTISSAIIGIPIGIFLAFGKKSDLPIIKILSTLYIDWMRSIPLIAVLFFGQLLTPLFLPMGMEINRVLRCIISFALFFAAYIAEDIRGGLQSIPKHQIESARVLGFTNFQTNIFIILPQALIVALPALTNQVIGLLQNTTLMSILGLVELLGISKSLLANPNFIGLHLEVYTWLACLYWLVCTCMALLSRHLEKRFQKTHNY